MCVEPRPGVKVLLIAPGYDPDQALRCDSHKAMSGVFARQVLWASGKEGEGWREMCRRLFHEEGHPCCVIDYGNQGSDELSRTHATLARVSGLLPQHVVLLGRDVEHLGHLLEALSVDRFTLRVLGFPRLEHWKKNARELREPRNSDLLRALASPRYHIP